MGQTITEPGLTSWQAQAFNAGAALEPLCAELLTPPEQFYVHNHGTVPRLDAARYRLPVLGEVTLPLSLSLAELREEFPKLTILTTLKCGGHQRQDWAGPESPAQEISCRPTGQVNAAGTAIWGGVSLRQILLAVGIEPAAKHVAFAGLDLVEVKTQPINYGCSIPLETALRPEVLLAYEMNGQPLTPEHGAPLRLIVPGETGAKSVKWLREIMLLPFPSTNYFQSRVYESRRPLVRY
jgi:sulfite oxidase